MPPSTSETLSLRERFAAWPIYQGALRWSLLLGTPTIAAGFASLLTLAANAGILRLLPEDDAGRYALWFAVAQSIANLSQLGQGVVLTRAYVRQESDAYNWPRDLAVTVGIASVAAALAVPVATLLYHVTLIVAVYLFVIAVTLASTYTISSILTAHRHYLWSALILRLPNGLLILALPLLLFLPGEAGLAIVLGASLLAALTIAVVGILVLRKHIPPGTQVVTWQDRINGSIFMVSAANNVVPEQGMLSIAGIFVPPSELAALAALTVLIRPMKLLQDVFYRVFLTEVARRDQMRHARILSGLWLLGISAGISIVLLGPSVAHWAYAGRYDQAMSLLPWLALTAVLKLGETFPRSHIVGVASMVTIRRYALVAVLTAVISIGLGLGLTIRYGLQGTVIAGSAIFLIRNLINYGFMALILRERRQSAV